MALMGSEAAQRTAQDLIGKYCPGDVVELGCVDGRLSGQFAERGLVLGYDRDERNISKAKEAYPKGTWLVGKPEKMQPIPCGVVVFNRVLEELTDPIAPLKGWKARCKYLLIIHQEDGRFGYDREDFLAWFDGFQILEDASADGECIAIAKAPPRPKKKY